MNAVAGNGLAGGGAVMLDEYLARFEWALARVRVRDAKEVAAVMHERVPISLGINGPDMYATKAIVLVFLLAAAVGAMAFTVCPFLRRRPGYKRAIGVAAATLIETLALGVYGKGSV